MNKRTTGAAKEELISSYLTEKGYKIIDRNFHSGRSGEIDIIAIKDGYICFVEVKYRKDSLKGEPEEAVSTTKMKRISKAAAFFILTHKQYSDLQMRFDVAAILGEDVRYYENAFPYTE